MTTLSMIILAMTLALAASQQHSQYQQQQQQQTYEDYEQAYDNQPRQAQPAPRSYSSAPAPQQRQEQPAAPKPTPVAILKQINRHNEDGSYTYGFEGADGSFKIETKLANGDVKGKYGFVDDSGKVRVVEYGADQYGFQPSGEGITVAPPTLIDETITLEPVEGQQQDYQEYRRPQQQRPVPQPAPAKPVYRQPPPPPQPQHEQYQTQAVYAPQPKAPIFAPAPQAQQSSLLRSREYEQAPASQAYNQGPVQFNPAPVRESHPAQARAAPTPAPLPGRGILDQLARDYALPQDAAQPLHDISFGYY